MISILIVGGMLLVMLSIVYMSLRNGISPMPSSHQVRQAVAKEVNQISKPGTLIDAGSGFGTLAVHLATHCPGWRVVGIENSPVPLWFSRIYWRLMAVVKRGSLPRDNVTLIKEDLYTYPYAEADVIVCYLYPGAMKKLNKLVVGRLTPGTRIISICFALPDWKPERMITCRDLYRTKVYIYHIDETPSIGYICV